MKAFTSFIGFIFSLSLFICLIGCQQVPTKVVAQDAVLGGDQLSGEKLTAENIMKEKPVILDVRPAFEFNLSHVPGAINIQWGDFSSSNSRYRGLLQTDLFALARRLALMGIDPNAKVVVLGKGSQGSGEEGRVAWTLKILGVHDVYTLLHTSYRALNVTKENLPPENKPYWKPQVHESLQTSVKEFKNKVEKTDQDTVVLDVRSLQEFNLHNLSQIKSVKVPVINIEWKAFFNEKGLPSQKVESLLANHKITNKTNLLIISDHGVRSGAVTYALNFLGYKKASNFAGGYQQLN